MKARISVTSVHVIVDVGVKKMDPNEGTGRMGEVKTCCHTYIFVCWDPEK